LSSERADRIAVSEYVLTLEHLLTDRVTLRAHAQWPYCNRYYECCKFEASWLIPDKFVLDEKRRKSWKLTSRTKNEILKSEQKSDEIGYRITKTAFWRWLWRELVNQPASL